MRDLGEILVMARNEQRDPMRGRHFRDMLAEGGSLLQLIGILLEARDAFAAALTQYDLLSDTGRLQAIRTQGMVTGLDQAIALIYQVAQEDEQDVQDTQVP